MQRLDRRVPETYCQRALQALMLPIARFCIRNAFPIQELVEAAKVCFLKAAREKLELEEQKLKKARIALMTGIHRNEIARLLESDGEPSKEPRGTIGRIMATWEGSPDFCTKSGQPRVLKYKGSDSEFEALVHSVSRHLTPGTVLYELERIGAIERTTRGVRLLQTSFSVEGDPDAGLPLLSKDIDALIEGVEENLFHTQYINNAHLATEYDNVFISEIPRVRRWLLREVKELHARARQYLARYDKDINTERMEEEGGGTVRLVAFSVSTVAKDEEWGTLEDYPLDD